MSEFKCPLCGTVKATTEATLQQFCIGVTCPNCGKFDIDVSLAQRPIANSHLVSGYIREANDLANTNASFTPPVLRDADTCLRFAAEAPRTVREKARKLLAAIERVTPHFGERVQVAENETAIAYAASFKEVRALVDYLKECQLISADWTSSGASIKMTAKGFEVFEGSTAFRPFTVFISSTCFDLIDVRHELAHFLELQGAIVRLSDDWSRFDVQGRDDSIETCLQNLEQSDVVFCILDRRYGGIVRDGHFAGKSATHVEVLHARDKRLPIYFFIRDKADTDYRQLRRKPDYEPEWGDSKNKVKWRELLDLAFNLPTSSGYSNWRDLFTTIVDLKKIAVKRLQDFARTAKH